jgi:dUTP pyrophosphatase
MIALPFRQLDDAARLPSRAHGDDAGLDLRSVEQRLIGPGERAVVRCGVAVAIPPGYCGLVLPRSGLAAAHGITILNAPGLIDAGYRGELMVVLYNTDQRHPFPVEVGDRVAQLVIVAYADAQPTPTAALGASERGAAGFGSSGQR